MDDIFYLSPEKLDTDRVCGVCVKNFKVSGTVQIYTKIQTIYMILMELSDFGELDQEFIQAKGILSMVCISHHKSYAGETLESVKLLFLDYDGVGRMKNYHYVILR